MKTTTSSLMHGGRPTGGGDTPAPGTQHRQSYGQSDEGLS